MGEAILVGRRPSSSKASRAAHGAELINYNSNAVRDDAEPEEPKEDSGLLVLLQGEGVILRAQAQHANHSVLSDALGRKGMLHRP